MEKHNHSELIKAWADGAQIQFKYYEAGWVNCVETPAWGSDIEYIKTLKK